jgi:hypothetical protein
MTDRDPDVIGGGRGWLLFSKPVSTPGLTLPDSAPVQVAKSAAAEPALPVEDGQVTLTGSREAIADLFANLTDPGAT